MIKYDDIELMFSGLPFEVKEFNYEANEISLPYVTYVPSSANVASADGVVYLSTINVRLFLYDGKYDKSITESIETVFGANEIFYNKQITFDDEARLYIVEYEFEAIN